MSNLKVNNLLVSAAFLCSVLSAVMAFEELSGLYIMLFLIVITVGAIIEIKHLSFLSRTVINVCSLALIVSVLSLIRRDYMIEPFMGTVLIMTAIKMLEKKSARDYMQLLLLSLMMLICYAMIYLDKIFVLYCFGEGIIWSFIMTLSAWQTKDPHAEVSFRNLQQLFSRLLVLFILMIPFCILMFIVTPRVRSPFFRVYGSRGGAPIGFSDQVVLGDVSEIQKNGRLAFRAEVSRQQYVPYWRGVVLNSFDGRMWRSFQAPRSFTPIFTNEETARTVKQEIYLELRSYAHLFALDVPISISKVEAQVMGDAAIAYRGPVDGRRLQYSAISIPSSFIRMRDSNFNKQHYLYLPPNYIPRLMAEVENNIKNLSQPQKISAILEYLSPPNFEYSITDMSNTSNALEHFIYINKKGNCEFFASAMGVMLRMAGIPSRLVGGYRGGIYNDAGGYYAVFEDSAHVWVELWDDENNAWIRFDPTPYSLSDESGSGVYGFWEAYLDYLDYQWTKFVLNYNLDIQGEVFSSVKNLISNPGAYDFTGFVEYLPIASGIIGLIIIGVYFSRKVINRNEGEALLRKFILIMKKKGFHKHKSEGLHEFTNQLPEQEKTKAMQFIERFEEYYYKDKKFDETIVKTLKENIKALKDY